MLAMLLPARLHAIARQRVQGMLGDKLSLGLVILALLINGLTVGWLLTRVHPTDFPVPVRYSNFEGFTQLGPWYSIFFIPGFGLAVTLINTVLALLSFERNRMASFLLLVGSISVGLFCLVISTAFAAIV